MPALPSVCSQDVWPPPPTFSFVNIRGMEIKISPLLPQTELGMCATLTASQTPRLQFSINSEGTVQGTLKTETGEKFTSGSVSLFLYEKSSHPFFSPLDLASLILVRHDSVANTAAITRQSLHVVGISCVESDSFRTCIFQ